MAALTSVRRGEEGGLVLPPRDSPVQLSRYLERRGLAVLDVVSGAAANSRRLLLGVPRGNGNRVTHVVAMSFTASGTAPEDDPVDNEERVLRHAYAALTPDLQTSLPRVLHHVDVPGLTNALAMTAVPQLETVGRPSSTGLRDRVEAMPSWFAAVWAATADGTTSGSLGKSVMPLAPARGTRPGASSRALDLLRQARVRIAACEVPRTLTHGCLCARHIVAVSGHVVGVDDWGRGETSGDPMRDLGRFAAHLAGDRLPEVLAGRTSFAAMVRQLMTETMTLTPVPPRLWREVLVLSQLEIAVEAQLNGDPRGMLRLGYAVQALQASDRGRRGCT